MILWSLFGAKQCFRLRILSDIQDRKDLDQTYPLYFQQCASTTSQSPAYLDAQWPLKNKQSFLSPLLSFKTAISETLAFWLLSPTACLFCDSKQLAGFAVGLPCSLEGCWLGWVWWLLPWSSPWQEHCRWWQKTEYPPSGTHVLLSGTAVECNHEGPMGDSRGYCKGLMSCKLTQTFFTEFMVFHVPILVRHLLSESFWV